MNASVSGRSLASRRSPLALPAMQVRHLEGDGPWPAFSAHLHRQGLAPLTAVATQVLQINVGRLCNQTCHHCHVDAGPDRREVMSRGTMQQCLTALEAAAIPVVDITGGAPELNPDFRWLVERCRALDRHVIDRCNLTVLTLPSQRGLIEFLAAHQVEIIASLPCYLEENTDRQRGQGVFSRSVEALQALNQAGYGQPGTGLVLNLVANPLGARLPPNQTELEADIRREMHLRHQVTFNRLYALANLPVSRFLDDLMRSGDYHSYMDLLVQSFNPAAAQNLMCRETLSVSWDGRLYDCDFNQMLDLPVNRGQDAHLDECNIADLAGRRIMTGRHCFGCTAGAGSSCGGSLS